MKKIYLLLLAAVLCSAMQLSAQDLYLRGMTVPGWFDQTQYGDTYKFTQNGDVYTLNVAEINGAFKIAAIGDMNVNNGWINDANYGPANDQTIETGGVYTVIVGDGSKNFMPKDGEKLENVTITFNKAEMKVTITGQAQAAEITYGIKGTFYENWPTDFMTKGEDGLWSADINIVNASGEFIIVKLSDGNEQAWYKGASISNENKTATLSTEGLNCKYNLTAGHKYTFTFNPENLNLTIEDKGEGGTVAGPDALYFFGNLDGDNYWSDCWNVAMTKDGNKFTHKFEVTATGSSVGYICFCTSEMDQSSWTHTGVRYGSETKDMHAELGTSYNLVVTNDNCFTLGTGKYIATVTFDEHGTPSVVFANDTETGIESIVAGENAVAPVYYNLQGVRVDNPTTGLYIVVRGNKVAKEMLR